MTVLITGCASGFGRDLVNEFLAHGWTVVATLRRLEERRANFSEQLKSYPGKLHLIELDVNSAEQRSKLVAFVKENLGGKLDVLVNNAGTGFFGALTDYTEAQIREQMEINFFSVAYMTRDLLPIVIANKGRIINLSSVLGFMGLPFSSIYNASKFAVEGLTESLYFELQGKGVQVSLVEPGGFRTNFATNIAWAEGRHSPQSLFHSESRNFESMRNLLTSRPKGPSPMLVVRKIVKLAQSDKMPLRVQVGQDSVSGYIMKKVLPEAVFLKIYSKILLKMMKKGENNLLKGSHAAKSQV